MKYPLITTYIKTRNSDKELKCMLRSLKNITNHNGQVIVVGDREPWFYHITHVPSKRIFGKLYLDQVKKLYAAAYPLKGKIIIGMDDLYALEPTKVSYYHRGELTGGQETPYKRTKLETANVLREMGIEKPLDYECHTFYLVERDKFIQTLKFIMKHPKAHQLQWRSMYGNIHNPKSEFFDDKKTKTSQLKQGVVISTQFYTKELEALFPEPSDYEVVI